MLTVTLASADTLTRGGGRVDIPGLSMDGQSYSGIRGYSDKGGGRVDIPGLSMDGHSYSGICGYSDKGGGGGGGRVDIPGLSMDGHSYSQLSTKQLCPSMDGRGLSTAPLDISAERCVLLPLSIDLCIVISCREVKCLFGGVKYGGAGVQ